MSDVVVCECGVSYGPRGKASHVRGKIHLAWVLSRESGEFRPGTLAAAEFAASLPTPSAAESAATRDTLLAPAEVEVASVSGDRIVDIGDLVGVMAEMVSPPRTGKTATVTAIAAARSDRPCEVILRFRSGAKTFTVERRSVALKVARDHYALTGLRATVIQPGAPAVHYRSEMIAPPAPRRSVVTVQE